MNLTQRTDGVQNQYSIHIFDWDSRSVETLWRAYNPRSRSKYGLGAWVTDNTTAGGSVVFPASLPTRTVRHTQVSIRDRELEEQLRLRSNPFVFSNAEKISEELILDLFISDSTRHANATRLAGDAIVRGPRGSGKTMLLRYLYSFASATLRHAFENGNTAECLPVFVNFSRIHRADLQGAVASYTAAEQLIYDCVLDEIDKKAKAFVSNSFKAAVHATKQRLEILRTQAGTPISHLGTAIRDHLGDYFGHVLLLLDEVSPVFPRDFFVNRDAGFLAWMNSIRNAGPFWTRVAVYPNDISDILNEERFGTIVNLEYDVRKEDEYRQFRTYSVEIADAYLKVASVDPANPTLLRDIVGSSDTPSDDALEQILYAADGSSRRFLSLMDRCLRARKDAGTPLTKEACLDVISETANNLLSGYSVSDQEVAAEIAKVCRRNTTFRFRMPYGSQLLRSLYSSREELNVIKLVEPRAGSRGALYEFTYPYCILMDIQTHAFRDSGRVCSSRDRESADWITRVTSIEKDSAELFGGRPRLEGTVSVVEGGEVLIELSDGRLVSSESDSEIQVGARVSLLLGSDQTGFDLRPI